MVKNNGDPAEKLICIQEESVGESRVELGEGRNGQERDGEERMLRRGLELGREKEGRGE